MKHSKLLSIMDELANSSQRSFIVFGSVPNRSGRLERQTIRAQVYGKDYDLANLPMHQLDSLTELIGDENDDDAPFYGVINYAKMGKILLIPGLYTSERFITLGYIAGYIDRLLNIPEHVLVGDGMRKWQAWAVVTPVKPEPEDGEVHDLPDLPDLPELPELPE